MAAFLLILYPEDKSDIVDFRLITNEAGLGVAGPSLHLFNLGSGRVWQDKLPWGYLINNLRILADSVIYWRILLSSHLEKIESIASW